MPAQSRQLAAIMFTDIVGYTALMGEDEQKAFKLLKKNRSIQRPIIEKYNGRWLKEIGDGVLASFSTVSDAVYCAGTIQKACENEPDLKLRIGIHEGEVVFEGNDVFGDGVNIASRLEPLAPIGGILVSESVHKNVLNKQDIETTFVGEKELKNVREPVRMFLVQVDGVEPTVIETDSSVSRRQATPKLPSLRKTAFWISSIIVIIILSYFFYKKLIPTHLDAANQSIAVLPFIDMSPDQDQEYLGDGIAENIINSLSRLEGLKVVGRTSSFQFKEKSLDLREIGERLDVTTVVEGSIQKAGTMLRITIQLIDVTDNFHIWSERYDREIDDIFAIQDEIANEIAEKLKITLLDSEVSGKNAYPTANTDAYELVLQGNYFLREGEELGDKAAGFFRRAIELDPSYVDAKVGLAWAYFFAGRREDFKKAVESVAQLNLDDGRQYLLLGALYMFHEWDWIKTRDAHQKWLLFNDPGEIGWGYFLAISGKIQEAINELKLVVEKDPLHHQGLVNLGGMYIFDQQYEEATQIMKYLIELYPDYGMAHERLGHIYMLEGQYDLAIKSYKRAEALFEGFATTRMDVAICLARAGKKLQARQLVQEVLMEEESYGTNITSTYWIRSSGVVKAQVYFALDSLDEAFGWLNVAYQNREYALIELELNHFYDPYRNDPRWQQMLDKVGFPE